MKYLFDKNKLDKFGSFLIKRKESIAVAESVTAGYLQAALASAENALLFFQGGITTYNIGQKSRHLLIEPIHAAGCNCVSEQVAGEMAMQVCIMFNSNWGVGITGYANAVPESGNKIFCNYAIAHHHRIVKKGLLTMQKGEDTFNVQVAYVNKLIGLLSAQARKK